MNKLPPLPYYKWEWQAFRASRAVQRMDYIQKGLYRELLDECWVEGCIPNDIESLADICGCPVDVMAIAWKVLSKRFVEKDGFLVNEMLDSKRTEKDQERANKSLNGKQGGIKKAKNNNSLELSESTSLASANQVPSTCHIEEKRREEKSKVSMSGKPDQISKQILIYLNQKTGRSYKPVSANLKMIEARLKEYSYEQLIEMIEQKCNQWQTDEKMTEYLRPKTLFNATNCASYVGELGAIKIEKPWFLISAKIIEYGKNKGIEQADKQWKPFSAEVFKTYGITKEQYQKAKVQWTNQ